MKKKVTISLDVEDYQDAKEQAELRGLKLSQWMKNLLFTYKSKHRIKRRKEPETISNITEGERLRITS